MIRFFKNLIPFQAACAPSLQIEIYLELAGSQLILEYKITGKVDFILFPKKRLSTRVIGLWESTCFELFIKNPHGNNYMEFNFSPEGLWNCFYFARPKDSPLPYENFPKPKTELIQKDGEAVFCAALDLKYLPKDLRTNLSELFIATPCVLEDRSGNLSYWAYSHQNEFPNFHNFATFLPLSFDPM